MDARTHPLEQHRSFSQRFKVNFTKHIRHKKLKKILPLHNYIYNCWTGEWRRIILFWEKHGNILAVMPLTDIPLLSSSHWFWRVKSVFCLTLQKDKILKRDGRLKGWLSIVWRAGGFRCGGDGCPQRNIRSNEKYKEGISWVNRCLMSREWSECCSDGCPKVCVYSICVFIFLYKLRSSSYLLYWPDISL